MSEAISTINPQIEHTISRHQFEHSERYERAQKLMDKIASLSERVADRAPSWLARPLREIEEVCKNDIKGLVEEQLQSVADAGRSDYLQRAIKALNLESDKTGVERSRKTDEQLRQEVQGLNDAPIIYPEQPKMKNGLGRHDIPIGYPPELLFQARTYGRPLAVADKDAHRVYFQVEVVDIPEMVGMLERMGIERAYKGEGLDFKFLLGSRKPVFPEPGEQYFTPGVYENLDDGEPRVVAYFNSGEERVSFLQALMRDPDRANLMRRMSAKRGNEDIGYKARRPGSHVLYDMFLGRELRAINYTTGGYSEDVLRQYGDDWRSHRRGSPTRMQKSD